MKKAIMMLMLLAICGSYAYAEEAAAPAVAGDYSTQTEAAPAGETCAK
ncbi:MAG TPA: hypothetical protein PKY78_07325 [Candidatus Omnitrophota bacterium]|nr:hypothetical protein [Candidatus Omnitrophota bacterium]